MCSTRCRCKPTGKCITCTCWCWQCAIRGVVCNCLIRCWCCTAICIKAYQKICFFPLCIQCNRSAIIVTSVISVVIFIWIILITKFIFPTYKVVACASECWYHGYNVPLVEYNVLTCHCSCTAICVKHNVKLYWAITCIQNNIACDNLTCVRNCTCRVNVPTSKHLTILFRSGNLSKCWVNCNSYKSSTFFCAITIFKCSEENICTSGIKSHYCCVINWIPKLSIVVDSIPLGFFYITKIKPAFARIVIIFTCRTKTCNVQVVNRKRTCSRYLRINLSIDCHVKRIGNIVVINSVICRSS